MEYGVVQDQKFPDQWRVEGIDYETGDVFVPVFGSKDAETHP